MASAKSDTINALLNATKTDNPGFKLKGFDVSIRDNGSVDLSFSFNPVKEEEKTDESC